MFLWVDENNQEIFDNYQPKKFKINILEYFLIILLQIIFFCCCVWKLQRSQ